MRVCVLAAIIFVTLASGTFSACHAEDLDFSRDVLPILSGKCFQCHGPDQATRHADLRLDSFEGATADLGDYAAVEPFKPEDSVLVDRVFDVDDPMPPADSKLELSDQEKETLRRWIAEGARYAKHWAFTPPARPDIPGEMSHGNPIDAFVVRQAAERGLTLSPEATPERLVRRVTLDLTGVPPTIEEVRSFVRDYAQRRDDAYSDLVDRLIQSPRYGETMALPWLDAARFADTDGYQYDGPRYQWRWRDWVIDAYNHNMPFDRFTIHQLAGDLLPEATIEQRIATGFNRNHRYNSEAGSIVEEFLLENAVDRVDTTSTLWMGLTMGCARCHDHKYDPISQKDYYQLIAFFNSVPEAGRAIKTGNSEPLLIAPTPAQQERLAELEAAVASAKAAVVAGDKPQNGGPLIDRKLIKHYPLKRKPDADAKLAGDATFASGALQLDGASSVELTGQAKSNRFAANQRFSISFWVRPKSLDDAAILSRQSTSTTRPGIEIAIVEEGRVRFDLVTRWIAGVGRATTVESLQPDQWTHVTVTNDGSQSANGQRIYFNGRPAETTVTINTNSNTGGADVKRPLVIGKAQRPGSGQFSGSMKELRIYETDLWPEEVAVLGQSLGSDDRKRFSREKMTPEYKVYVRQREALDAYRRTLPTVMVMKESESPKETFVRRRGVYNDYGERVARDVPSVLPAMDESLPANRLGFARWLIAPEHPLTARVAVNRYWQKYFGTGLVKTAEDFGVQGDPPSHPELLDWLATEFVRTGWDVARMQKLIVTSRTYRQSSRVTEASLEADPENRWLARFPRLRMTGHAIRDQALFVSGLLTERIGGPSVSPYQPANMWAEMSMGMKYKPSKGSDLFRRSLYTIWKRTVAPPTMAVFDAADREACWVRRKETNTPLQALTLLNETGFVENARHLAARMMTEGGDDPIGFGFQSLTSRLPTAEERAVLESALNDYVSEFQKQPQRAAELLSVGQSPQHPQLDSVKHAAMTSLANVLLNLDEAITRE